MRKNITVRVSEKGLNALGEIAEKHGLSRSEVIREALRFALNNPGQFDVQLQPAPGPVKF